MPRIGLPGRWLTSRSNIRKDEEGHRQMSQPKQPFQIGDKVIYFADPDHIEHVLACEWVEAPVPHWRVETIFSVAGGENPRIAGAAEFPHAPGTPRPDDIAPASMSVATKASPGG